jgi:hypothetical protein
MLRNDPWTVTDVSNNTPVTLSPTRLRRPSAEFSWTLWETRRASKAGLSKNSRYILPKLLQRSPRKRLYYVRKMIFATDNMAWFHTAT